MPLIHSRIGGKEVIKTLSFRVPDIYAATFRQYNRKRMVIMGSVLIFELN
jgi:hypothetical protein